MTACEIYLFVLPVVVPLAVVLVIHLYLEKRWGLGFSFKGMVPKVRYPPPPPEIVCKYYADTLEEELKPIVENWLKAEGMK